MTYQWQYASPVFTDIPDATNATYEPTGIYREAAGDFRCVARAEGESAISLPAHLSVVPTCQPPALVSVAGNLGRNRIRLRFNVPMDSLRLTDPFNYQWQQAPPMGEPWLDIAGANAASYLTPPAARCAILPVRYRCQIATADGTVVHSRVAYLRVTNDCTSTFTAAASLEEGLPSQSFLYQWFRNGRPIPGANGRSLTVGPITGADHDAKYQLTARLPGGCAAAVSLPATLNVVVDTVSLRLIEARPGLAPNVVVLQFASGCGSLDDRLLPEPAGSVANYRLSGDPDIDYAYVDCTSATVELFTADPLPAGAQTVTIQNLTDLQGHGLGTSQSAPFTVVPREPVPPGQVRYRAADDWAAADEIVLEWAAGGILQTAPSPDGPWFDAFTRHPYFSVYTRRNRCLPDTDPQRFYRVCWPGR